MNKTILTSFFIITNFLGFNAFAETGTTTDNVRTESTQSILSKDGQVPNVPKTDLTKSIGVNIKSNTATNPDGTNWGEGIDQPYFRYSNSSGVANCEGSGSSCAGTGSKDVDLLSKEGTKLSTLAIPTDTGIDKDGFVTATSSSIVSDGDVNDKGYFYRYWNENCNLKKTDKTGALTTENLNGCWSPSYPKVCYQGYDNSDFSKLNDSSDIDEAKNYFGVRGNLRNNGNSYYQNLKSYQINAELTPDTNASSSTKFSGDYVNGITPINVVSWTKNSTQNCLDPDFNFGNLVSDDATTQYIKNPTNVKKNKNDIILQNKMSFDGEEIILPCGVFTNTVDNTEMSQKYNAMILDKKMVCNSGSVYRSKQSATEKYFTRYRVKLPTNKVNNYVDGINGPKYLNVRACAVCKSLANECKNLIYAVLESHGCKNGQCPKETDLESVIRDLRTKTSFDFNNSKKVSDEYSDIRYATKLQCDHNKNDNCLVHVENILKEYFKITG